MCGRRSTGECQVLGRFCSLYELQSRFHDLAIAQFEENEELSARSLPARSLYLAETQLYRSNIGIACPRIPGSGFVLE